MSTIEIINKTIGEENFVNKSDGNRPLLALRTNKRVTLIIDREIIGPFINRSTDPSDTIRYRAPTGRQYVRVPSRKFKSKEKLRGLEVCRAYGLVNPGYEYNNVTEIDQMNNPNSVLFGDTNVQGDAAGLPSKFIYGEGLSTDEVANIAQPLTHNALSEEGTMWDKTKGSFRTSLFETMSILPGAHIVQTITLDSPTPETLMHLILCLRATRYGAQTSVTGPNIKNHVIAYVASRDELPITAYTLVAEMSRINISKQESLNNLMIEAITESLKDVRGTVVLAEDAESLTKAVQSASDLADVYNSLKNLSNEFHQYVYGEKKIKKTAAKSK